jgi:hypothetical protein
VGSRRSSEPRGSRALQVLVGVFLLATACLALTAQDALALPERFYGMTAHEVNYDQGPDYGEANWEAMQKAGVQRFRMQVKWSKVVSAGSGNWKTETAWQNSYDQYFKRAANHGIAILPFLYTRKNGSQAYYQVSPVADAELPEWKEFVWTVVQRYGQEGKFWKDNPGLTPYPVKVWEVWNEPNLKANSPNEAVNGKSYAEFLKETSKTIHSAQEAIYKPDGSIVLFAGIYRNQGDTTSPIGDYLSQAAEVTGITSWYNGLSLHPYAIDVAGETAKYNSTIEEITEAYTAQNNILTTGKSLWITEFGWPPIPGKKSNGSSAGVVSLEEQSNLLSKTYAWLAQNSAAYDIRYGAWYFYRDYNSDSNAKWDLHCGLRDASGNYRPAWYAYEQQTGVQKWPAPGGVAEDLGFLRLNHPLGKSELVTYNDRPYYKNQSAYSLTDYPSVSDPENVRTFPIDTNGDGVDELAFVRLNHSSGQVELVLEGNAPYFNTQSAYSLTGYPKVSDPQNVQVLPIDTNADGKDELAFVRLNHSSGQAELVIYGNGPSYTTQAAYSLTGYPKVSDPQNIRVLALDTNADGKDELAFARLNHSSGQVELVIYGNAPYYTNMSTYTLTGYPKVSDPQNVQVLAIDTNADGVDELGFVRLNHASGQAELVIYGNAPNYTNQAAYSLTGYPTNVDPKYLRVIAYRNPNPYPPTPPMWHSDNLGGVNTSDPDATSMYSGHMDMFARGSDGALWHRYFSSGSWSNWSSLGGSLATGAGPGADSWANGRMDVVGRAPGGNITHWWYDGTWHSGDNLGGTFTGDPDIASMYSGHIDVFARGTDGALWHKYEAGGVWSGWSSLGGSLASDSGVGAVSWGNGRIDVVGRAPNNTVTHWWYDGTWHSGDNLGGNITGTPDISSRASGVLDIWARGTDGTLQHKWYINGWSGWEGLGGSMASGSGPGAVSWADGRIDVFGRTTDANSTIFHWWWQ